MPSAITILSQGTLADIVAPGESILREAYADGYLTPPGLRAAGDLILTSQQLLWFQRRTRLNKLLDPRAHGLQVHGIVQLALKEIESIGLWESRWLRAQSVNIKVGDVQLIFTIPEWALGTTPRAIRWRSVHPRPSKTVEWANALKQIVESHG